MTDSDSQDDTSEQGIVEKSNQPEGGMEPPAEVIQELHQLAAFSGTVPHPIFQKLESEHLTEILAGGREAAREELSLQRSGRWFRLVYVLVGVATFVFLTLLLLPQQSDTYFQLLGALGIFATGVAGGLGFSEYRNRLRH